MLPVTVLFAMDILPGVSMRAMRVLSCMRASRASLQGLESSNLIIGVDFTKSNVWTGAKVRCLVLLPGAAAAALALSPSRAWQLVHHHHVLGSCCIHRWEYSIAPTDCALVQSFEGRSLHDLWAAGPNPYQRTIDIVSRTLSEFDDDQLVPAYGSVCTVATDCLTYFSRSCSFP